MKYRGDKVHFFTAVTRGEIKVPGGEFPGGIGEKAGGPHNTHTE